MIKADSRVEVRVCGAPAIGRVINVSNNWARIQFESGAFYGKWADFPITCLVEIDENPRAAEVGYIADVLERACQQWGKAMEGLRRAAATGSEALAVYAAAFRRMAQ